MRPRLVLALVVAAGLLAACSSGSDSSSGSNPSAGSDATTVAAKPSSGCTATPVEAGEQKVTIGSGAGARWYFRHVPPSYDGKEATPVVLDLHGYAEGAQVHLQMSALGTFGDDKGFITITPQGLGAVARWDTGLDSADMKFVGDLLDEADDTLCVDERRVYVTGLSNGAFMTSAIACKYADRVAAAAPVAGIRTIPGCAPSRPVPVIAFHGTADTFVAYDGGLGSSVADLPSPDGSGKTLGESGVVAEPEQGPTIDEITAAWAERNGCQPDPTERSVANDVDLIRFKCPAGADAELYRVRGGGHSWPGSEFSKAVASVIGPTTSSISANELMWKFFEAHPLTRR